MWITRRDLSKVSCCGLLLILLLIRKCLEVCPNLFNIKIHVLSIYKYKRLYLHFLKKIWTCLYLINRIYLKVAHGSWMNNAEQNFLKIHEDFSVSINCDFLLQTELWTKNFQIMSQCTECSNTGENGSGGINSVSKGDKYTSKF